MVKYNCIPISYLFSEERDNAGLDGSAGQLSVGILGDEAGPYLDLVTNFKDAL